MKKIVTIILTIITIPTYATTMCVKNDSVAIVLPTNMDGTSSSYNNKDWSWSTVFPYGTIYGWASCTSGGIPTKIKQKDGVQCFCKIIHPVVSKWVHIMAHGGCTSLCPTICADYIKTEYEKRENIFATIKN